MRGYVYDTKQYMEKNVERYPKDTKTDAKRLRDSRMFRMNTWDVVCGDGDQGLFVFIFLTVSVVWLAYDMISHVQLVAAVSSSCDDSPASPAPES